MNIKRVQSIISWKTWRIIIRLLHDGARGKFKHECPYLSPSFLSLLNKFQEFDSKSRFFPPLFFLIENSNLRVRRHWTSAKIFESNEVFISTTLKLGQSMHSIMSKEEGTEKIVFSKKKKSDCHFRAVLIAIQKTFVTKSHVPFNKLSSIVWSKKWYIYTYYEIISSS